jgi:hypothetical protein
MYTCFRILEKLRGWFSRWAGREKKEKEKSTYARMQCQHGPVIELHFHNPDHADAVVDGHGAVHLGFSARREVDD